VIEFNPGEAWLSSGSALYDWRKDRDVLNGKKKRKDGKPWIRILRKLISDDETKE